MGFDHQVEMKLAAKDAAGRLRRIESWCKDWEIGFRVLDSLPGSETIRIAFEDQRLARAFIGQHAPLDFYSDPNMKLAFDLVPPAPGMPTTVIYGADGVERARLSGGADWSGADAKALIDHVLAAE